jgi:hypothetical protein
MSADPLRVLVADDYPFFRDGLRVIRDHPTLFPRVPNSREFSDVRN